MEHARPKMGPLERKKLRHYLMMMLPGFIIFTIGIIVPMMLGIYYSLTDWDGFAIDKVFVGLSNYANIIKDQNALNAWKFTLQFTILNTIIQNVLALGMALLLNQKLKGKGFYRTAIFMPCLISAVVVGYIWSRMFSVILPSINDLLGTNINFYLFSEGRTVLAGLLITNNWQWMGYWMLIYLAGLQSISHSLYESAQIAGANKLQQFTYITLPMLAPSLTVCIVGITVGSLRVYDLLVNSTGGGPGRASTSIVFYVYNIAITSHKYGYGMALSMTLVLALIVVAVVQLTVLRKREVQI